MSTDGHDFSASGVFCEVQAKGRVTGRAVLSVRVWNFGGKGELSGDGRDLSSASVVVCRVQAKGWETGRAVLSVRV